MFSECSSLRAINLSSFKNDYIITDMFEMLFGCTALKDVKEFNFKIDKISYIDKMFIGCHDDLKNNIKFKIKNK